MRMNFRQLGSRLSTGVRSWGRARLEDESGATLVIVSVSLIALVGATALAVDGGALWFTRRNLVVDVDAAALATAMQQQDRVLSGLTCDDPSATTHAEGIVADNDPDSVLVDVAVTCSGKYGKVTVDASKVQNHYFAGIFPGAGASTNVGARSIAEFGPFAGTDSLRPLPLCVGSPADPSPYWYWNDQKIDSIGEAGSVAVDDLFMIWEPSLLPPSTGIAWKITIDAQYFAEICNPDGLPAPAQFRWIDFDGDGSHGPSVPCPNEGTENGANELRERFKTGYQCVVYSDKYTAGPGPNCIPDSGAWTGDNCPTTTGNVTAIINCLNGSGSHCIDQICPLGTPAADCQHKWYLLIYDKLEAESSWPSSMTPSVRPVGFVQGVPRYADNPGGTEKPFIAIEFIENAFGDGVIGGPGVDHSDLHVHGVRLCGAEVDDNSCKG